MSNESGSTIDYVFIRFDSSCEAVAVNQYRTVDQTLGLSGEIAFWIRDALFHADDCAQAVVITAKDPPQLQTAGLLDEYVKRSAKFLFMPETEEDRSMIVWLNDYLARGNANACIYIAGLGTGWSTRQANDVLTVMLRMSYA
jgi:hypothetical protein